MTFRARSNVARSSHNASSAVTSAEVKIRMAVTSGASLSQATDPPGESVASEALPMYVEQSDRGFYSGQFGDRDGRALCRYQKL